MRDLQPYASLRVVAYICVMSTHTLTDRRVAWGAVLASTSLLVTGCIIPSGGSDASSSSAPASSSAASGAQQGIDAARPAVVRVEVEGSYVDPAEGRVASGGSGSGFIIDPEGHVVTNAHVVEGAGLVRVYVEDQDEPVTARVLGVSECNDLAVLDLSGDAYPYLAWQEGDVDTGTDIYVAGFPLGDPEFSLTRGIISKARADGDSSWASIPYALEHDAAIQPGNSGGPLLSADGQVVGINYASSDPTNTSQYFAIPAGLARDVVETLVEGTDVESLGINGFAWYDDADEIGGIWVSGIRAGSAASNVGVEPGDILLSLAGRDVVTAEDNATKRGYCDVLRTQGDTKAMEIAVYRPDTGELLEGEINNPAKPLEVVGTVTADDGDTDTDGGTSTAVPAGFRRVTDSTGRMTTVAPNSWEEIQKGATQTDYGPASSITLTPDDNNFLEGNLSAPGAIVYFFSGLPKSSLLEVRNFLIDEFGFAQACVDDGGTNKPTRTTSKSGDVYYWVEKYYRNCGTSGIDGYVTTMYYPDQDAMAALVGASNNDKQYDTVIKILRGIDIS